MSKPDGDPPIHPGKATVTADQIGSSAISSRGVVTPSSHIVFKPRDFLVPVPPDDPVDDEDEEIDDPPPTTPVEAVEETDEVPIVAPPTVTHDTANTLYTDLAGPRGPAPKEIDMINANPNSPAPQKPEEKSRLRGALVSLAGVAIVLVIVVTIGLRKPVDDNSVPPPPPPPIVHATEVADATPPAAPPRPPEIPTPDALEVPDVVEASPTEPMATNPTTGYEADEPSSATASEGKPVVATVVPPTVAKPAPVAIPIAKPIPVAIPVAKPAPIVASAPVAKPVTPPPTAVVVAPKVVAATVAPTTTSASEIPRSVVVSAMGKNPACKGAYAWGNLDPADGYPFTVNGTHVVTGPGGSYVTASWTKITSGPQKYCYTATGITAP